MGLEGGYVMLSYEFELTTMIQADGGRLLDLSRDLLEAANFATYFTASPASLSIAHLYISPLATWSTDSGLSRAWKSQFPRIPSVNLKQTKRALDIPLVTIHCPTGVESTAFSGDGMRIVSGSRDQSVRVWDASTGAELKTLEGHTESVVSVVFSSDGTRIVSGSKDNCKP